MGASYSTESASLAAALDSLASPQPGSQPVAERISSLITSLPSLVGLDSRDSAGRLTAAVPLDTLNRIARNQPEHMATLLTTILSNTRDAIKTATSPTRDALLINCVRLLTRCLIVLSGGSQSSDWSAWVWGGALPKAQSEEVASAPSSSSAPASEAIVGQRLLATLLELLFLEGFCVQPAVESSSSAGDSAVRVHLSQLWEASDADGPLRSPNMQQRIQQPTGSSPYDSNRVEVLRCMLVCLTGHAGQGAKEETASAEKQEGNAYRVSDSIPLPPAAVSAAWSRPFLRELVSSHSPCARWTPTLCWSLLNCILNFRPDGATTIMQQMPYAYALVELRLPLVEAALQALLLALQADCNSGEVDTPASASSSSVPFHTFRSELSSVSHGGILCHIYTNMSRLLLNGLAHASTWLPGSLQRLSCYPELVQLLWQLMEANPYLVAQMIKEDAPPNERCELMTLVAALLYYMQRARHDPSQLSLVYACVLILFRMSSSRAFSTQLLQTVPVSALAHMTWFLPILSLPEVAGTTYADVLVLISFQLLHSNIQRMESVLVLTILTMLRNISPYINKLNANASECIADLLDTVMQPEVDQVHSQVNSKVFQSRVVQTL